MIYFLVRHKNKDYANWKKVFDEHNTIRKTSGSKGARLLRNADDPNEIVIFTEWDSLEKARKFAQSEDLKKTMQQAGVIDKPDVTYLKKLNVLQA